MKALLAVCAMLLLAGCERGMHDMYDQPKYKPGASSPLFSDGRAGRVPPLGTIAAARGGGAATSSGRYEHATATGPGADPYLALLQRGRQRYDIDCAPCHGIGGAGDGMVVQRGFPAPPPLTSAAMLRAGDAQMAQAIQRGYGVMYPFADRVDAADTQAIVAYIHALQLSRHADAAQLPPQDRQALQRAAR